MQMTVQGNSNIATVTITINAINDWPVAVDNSYTTNEDTPLTVVLANSILINDTDAEGNALTAVLDVWTCSRDTDLETLTERSPIRLPQTTTEAIPSPIMHETDGAGTQKHCNGNDHCPALSMMHLLQ